MSNKNKQIQKWVITVANGACGTGAGGLQFANGRAECFDERIANWYKSKGYTVTMDAPKVGSNTAKNQDKKSTEPLADLTPEETKEPKEPKDPEETKEPDKESV